MRYTAPLRFGLVGIVGYIVDSVVLKGFIWLHWNVYFGQALSYITAATVTWILNRKFTFIADTSPTFSEWARYLGANAVGGTINYITFVFSIRFFPQLISSPFIPVALGSLTGMLLNFAFSIKFVFRSRRDDP